ncbi:hypothetical protein SKAU_G00406270 [Synaphobranchus kaupii]|uniref:Uncharacterized protein n=1 Tax=Synaphobranchus kaupii TaxID=118154 RepID=A0A9Q1EA34_SYNKA|nr:hypothetical protein SKAU_G00406270 [Synaphobranchus kaupii]
MKFPILQLKSIIYSVQNITVAILLQITEHLMEPLFTCPCSGYKTCFVWMYFLIPAAAFTAFTSSLQHGNTFMKTCRAKYCPCCGGKYRDAKVAWCKNECLHCFRSWLRTLYPAFCWVVILLIDGKYAACGLYSKCNSTMSTVDMKDPEIVYIMTLSKIGGFTLVGVCAVSYLIYMCWYSSRSPADRYEEMYRSRLKEDREEFARKYVKMCSEKGAERCEKDLKKTANKRQSEARVIEPPEARVAEPPEARVGEQPETRVGEQPEARVREQPGTAGGGDPEVLELDSATIVEIIEKNFDLKSKPIQKSFEMINQTSDSE